MEVRSTESNPSSATSGTKVPNYDAYRQRLEPLVALEDRLTRSLSAPDEDEPTHLGPIQPSYSAPSNPANGARPSPTIVIPDNRAQSLPVSPADTRSGRKQKEVAVHTSTNWKKAFALGSRSKSPKSAHTGEIEGWWEDPDDPVHALHACAPAMLELWRDPRVRQRLQERRLRLEESSGL